MRITRKEKLLLALMLSGTLTVAGTAKAADTETISHTTYEYDASGSATSTSIATTTVTVTGTQTAVTNESGQLGYYDEELKEFVPYSYTDEEGEHYIYFYEDPSTEKVYGSYTFIVPTITTEGTTTDPGVSSSTTLSNLSYGRTGGTPRTYYWTTDTSGHVILTEQTPSGDEPTVTVTYTNDDRVDNTVTTAYSPTDTAVNINFIGNTAQPGSRTGLSAGITNRSTSTTGVEITSITGDFIANGVTGTGDTYGGAINNEVGSDTTAGYMATIGAIQGNFIGNYAQKTGDSEARGGAIQNIVRYGTYPTTGVNTASIESITGDFIGNYATSTGGSAFGGAIYNYVLNYDNQGAVTPTASSASIGDITGNFINNYVYSGATTTGTTIGNAGYASGGAIYNVGASIGVPSIGNITGDFIGNYADGLSYVFGGAIINESNDTSNVSIGTITGSFVGNYANARGGVYQVEGAGGGAYTYYYGGEAQGGAIYNGTRAGTALIGSVDATSNETVGLVGDFVGNYAQGTTGAYGGAIANWVDSSSETIDGGETATIGNITASNTTTITDESGATVNVGGFLYNYAVATAGDAAGGAIENRSNGSGGEATIGDITADFIGNYVSASAEGIQSVVDAIQTVETSGQEVQGYTAPDEVNALGGAIHNRADTSSSGDNAAIIGNITGNFIGNSATAVGGTYTSGDVEYTVQGDALGGAISNYLVSSEYRDLSAVIGTISDSYFIDNTVTADNYAIGGAIANGYYVTALGIALIEDIKDSYFVGNTATSNQGDSYGGAIFNAGIIGGTASYVKIYHNGTDDTTYYQDESGDYYSLDEDGSRVDYEGSTENMTYAGIEASVDSEATQGINNTYFVANEADRGGAIYNGSDKTSAEDEEGSESVSQITSISGSYFVSNTADKYGGAIYNYSDGQIWSITNSTFDSNVARDGNGGAIENAEAGSYIGTISGSTFTKNEVETGDHGGGAIYNEGIINTVTDNTFEENSSGNFGGALYNNGGRIYTVGVTPTDDDDDDTTNDTSSTFTGNTSRRGGAIYNTADRTNVVITTASGEITTEILDLQGVKTATTTISDTEYVNDTSKGTIELISGNTFTNNEAGNYGGAIYNYIGGEIGAISNNTFSENKADGGNGGAVENAEYGTSIGTMDNNEFTSNVATGNGGAIYNQGNIGIQDEDREVDVDTVFGITNSKFTSNQAANGGAIYNNYTTSTQSVYVYAIESTEGTQDGDYTINDEGTITPTAGSSVGYLIVNEAQTGTTITQTYSEDVLTDSSGNPYIVKIVSDGTVNGAGAIGDIAGSTFTGNQALGTGTLVTETVGDETVTTITRAGDAKGGAIYNAAGTVEGTETVYTSTINSIGSITDESGNVTAATAFVNNAAIATAASEDYSEAGDAAGGAIYNAGTIGSIEATGSVTVSVVDESGNTTEETYSGFTGNYAQSAVASAQGGAIYNSGTIGGTETVNGETVVTGIITDAFTGNYAKVASETGSETLASGDAAGGAIYNKGTIETIEAGAITGNTATSEAGNAYGGAIYNTGTASLTMTGETTVIGGTGENDGNSVSAAGVDENEVGNVAYGGAIYNAATGTDSLTLAEGIAFTNNTATSAAGEAAGGAIYNTGNISTVSEDAQQGTTTTETGTLSVGALTNNVATGATGAYGGAIYDTVSTSIYIDGSATGNGVKVEVETGSTVTAQGDVAGGVIYLEKATTDSTSITVTGNVTGNYATTVDGSAKGGAFYNGKIDEETYGTLTISGDTISGNYVTAAGTSTSGDENMAAGGAIYNEGTLNISATTITGNKATAKIATNATTSDNAYGGAIYNDGVININTDANADGLTLSNNSVTSEGGAAYGGAIYNTGTVTYGSGTTSSGTLNFADVTGNTATGATGAYGGAIYDTVSYEVNISGKVSGNSVTTTSGDVAGGVIYLEQAEYGATTINVTGNVSGNSATTASGSAKGGAFYNNGEGTLTITGTTIGKTETYDGNSVTAVGVSTTGEDNIAAGGAIYNEGTLNISATTITGNKATAKIATNATTSDNAYGGAIYNDGVININTDANADGLTLSNNSVTSEGGAAYGGAIYNTGTVTYGSGTTSSGTLNFADVTGNTATGATGAYGGAIYDTVSYEVNISGEVSGNSVTTTSGDVAGGVIYLEQAENGATTINVAGNVTGNSATTENGKAYGGAFSNVANANGTYGTLTISGGTIGGTGTNDGNYVSASGEAFGGAIYNTGVLNIADNVALSGNSATSTSGVAKGGAIYNAGVVNGGGTLVLGALTGNSAKGVTGAYGGAVYDTVSTSVTITGDVKNNTVETTSGDVAGGVIYLAKSDTTGTSIEVTASEISGNKATTSDGTAKGGAFYNNGQGTLKITMTDGGTISGNEVSAAGYESENVGYVAYGGAIYNDGTFDIDASNVTFSNNSATSANGVAAGGAIYNTGTVGTSGSETLTVGSLTGNSATGATGAYGGAIYDEVYTSVTINGDASNNSVKISEGGAGDVAGGVIYLEKAATDSTTITVTGKVAGNSAETASGTAKGGAFYNDEDGTLNIGGAIGETGNGNKVVASSYAYGGAIYNEGVLNIGGITTNGTTVYADLIGNSATSTAGDAAGGAIYNTGSISTGDTETLSVGSVIGNSAIGYTGAAGGAIYDTVYTSVAINGDVKDNKVETTSGNVAGGVIYLKKAEDDENSTTITVTANEISGNSATTGSGTAQGGAFYNNTAGTLNITLTDGDNEATISGNSASGSEEVAGGAIYNAGLLNINVGSEYMPTLSDNTVTSTGGKAYGGAIYNTGTLYTGNDDGTLNLGALTNNSATGATGAYGGAIYDTVSTEVDIAGDVSGNYVKTDSGDVEGGVIYLAKSSTDETKISVTGNVKDNHAETADGNAYGGAFYNNEKATLTITAADSSSASIISGNYVSASEEAFGGAIYNKGTLNIDAGNVTLSGNWAYSSEGAAAGGAIYNTGEISTGESETLSVGSVTGNYAIGATSAKGGAIYDEVYTSVSINGDVSDNHAIVTGAGDVEGGVIYLDKAGSEETSITVAGNVTGNSAETASGNAYGGAFFNDEQATLTIGGTEISGNYVEATANAYGGAIYNEGTFNIEADGVELSGNSATSTGGVAAGGAIYNTVNGIINVAGSSDGSTEILKVGSLTGNHADGYSGAYGGAIYDEVSTEVDITGKVDGNYVTTKSGDVEGGVLYLAKSKETETTINVTGNVTGNYAETGDGNAYGGAFYNNANGTLTIEAKEISENHVSASDEAYGGAIYNEGSLILADGVVLSGNYAVSSAGDAAGGAIYNTGTISGTEGDLTLGDITDNYVEGNGGEAGGGAIYNDNDEVAISVSGDITNNHATAGDGKALGGAIYTIGDVTVAGGKISNNKVEATGTATGDDTYDALGGAIYTEGILIVDVTSIEDNHATSASGDASGGAIFVGSEDDDVDLAGSITVAGKVYNNTVETESGDAGGGAISNDYTNTTISIAGDITYNYATTEDGDALGGAIYTRGDITVKNGAISNNYVESTGDALGGAIYSEGTLVAEVTSITDNHADGVTEASGGAIYLDDDGTGSSITVSGNVSNNTVTASEGYAMGGAIYIGSDSNTAKTTSITTYAAGDNSTEITIYGDLTNNSAEGTYAYGGAIYNDGGTVTLYGDITGNYVTADTDEDALGGAIYNAGTVNIIVEAKDAVISGNEANGEANVIYATEDSVTNFTLTSTTTSNASLTVEDSVKGETGYEVNVTGNGVDKTTFYMFNDFLDSDLSISGTTLNTINEDIHHYSVNSFTVAGDFNMAVDVDLENKTMDSFVTDGKEYGNPENTDGNYGTAKGTLNVSAMNLISDTIEDSVAIYFAEPGLKANVTSDVDTAYTPMYEYSIAYEQDDGRKYGANGGYFVFNNEGFNPAVMATSEAAMAAYGFMNMMFEYNFEHSDYYMKLPEEVRIAMQEEQEEAKEAQKEAEIQESDPTRSDYYNRHELTYHGAWVKGFASNESVDFGGGWDSRDKYYGTIFGFDTDMKVHDNGWASVFTGYAGTMGIRQQYSGGHIKQHGAFLGATASFYKKNFYTAWTIAGGTTKAHEHTMYGHDKDRLDEYGAAARIGWNFDFHDAKLSLLPTFTASYTYVHPEDFTNAGGVSITGSGVRAVQLNPNIKLIWNRDDGWYPYLTVGEVWTVAESTHMRANGTKLDSLDLDPYTEYGVGIQKRWANERDAYVQVLGHSHGRDGILVNAGIRWNF